MTSFLNITTNYSLYSVPVAYAFSLMPHVFAMQTYQKSAKKAFPIKQPRGFEAMVESDQSIDSKTKNRILRAQAAHTNGMENVGLYAAAVVAGNAAGVDSWWLNGLSIGYLVSRFVYNHIYIYNDLVPGEVRTATYFGGLGMIMGLFVLAGNKMKDSVLKV